MHLPGVAHFDRRHLEARRLQELAHLVAVDAKDDVLGPGIGGKGRLCQSRVHDLDEARGTTPLAAADAQPSAQPQNAREFGERPRLLRQPVEHRIQADDIDRTGRDRAQVMGAADSEFEVGPGSRSGDLDAQRQRVDAQHMAGGADDVGDVLGQQAGAAADIEHALARRDRQRLHQALARLELPPDADALVVARQLVAVLGERRSRPAANHGVMICHLASLHGTQQPPAS